MLGGAEEKFNEVAEDASARAASDTVHRADIRRAMVADVLTRFLIAGVRGSPSHTAQSSVAIVGSESKSKVWSRPPLPDSVLDFGFSESKPPRKLVERRAKILSLLGRACLG